MRICIISREYPPETGWGGIATFAKHLSHGLADLGHEVEVVSLAKAEPHSGMESGILVHRVRQTDIGGGLSTGGALMSYTRYVLATSTALWRKFIELHKQRPFDVIDCPELLAEGIGPALTKTAPLVVRLYTPHSKFIAERLHNVRPSLDHQMVAAIERVAMLSADVLTSPSDDLADFVALDLSYPRERIAIVRNPIDPEVFCPEGEKALVADGRTTILFVGRLEERKGIHYLIDAIPQVVAQHKNVRFVIVGDDTNTGFGQRSVLKELQAKVKEHSVGKYIEWIPRVSLDALPSYYRSADICVVPSVYDNSPYTCLEAMSCGRAVIGTSAGGTSEYIGTNYESGIIVPPRNADSLAAALIDLLDTPSKRQNIAARARERVLQHFQRKEIARQTVELYQHAQQVFAKRSHCKLYRRDEMLLYEDLEEFVQAWDDALYDMLFLEPAFRVVHYWRSFKTRPKLFIGRTGLFAIDKIFGKAAGNWKLTVKLRSEIEVKSARSKSAKSTESNEFLASSAK